MSAGRGTLTADVARGGTTLGAVPLVTFAAPRLVPKEGLAAVTEAPATLTAQGAAAFGGMYAAGTVMDPVSLAVTVDRAARLPALPDLGSEASPSPRQTTTAPATVSGRAPPAASSDTSSPTGTYLAVGAGALAAAAIALYVVRRRRTAQHWRRPTTMAATRRRPITLAAATAVVAALGATAFALPALAAGSGSTAPAPRNWN